MPLRDQSALGGSYWVLDRNGGKYILVTPANRQLYHDATRYINVHDMPVPTDTQEIIKILDAQHEEGIKQGEFTADDVNSATEGLTGRRFAQGQQARSRIVVDEPVEPNPAGHPDPLAGRTAEGIVDMQAPAETAPAPAEAPPAKKKAARKKAAKKKTE